MKTKAAVGLLLVAVTFFTIVGFATNKVDWNARIGTLTFDQAVVELGPPDKQQKLTDGRNVAEWITRFQNAGSVAIGTGFYTHSAGVGIIQSTGPTYYERKLRLTFNTNNVLTAWSRN